jgi:tetratricopeptide (TPR) repeat protein
MFFKKDIYRPLRPDALELGQGFPKFKKILDIDYKDALIYPRFKFCYVDKPNIESGIFETSDYKKVFEIFGNESLGIGSIIGYNSKNYEIADITIDILEVVIDYSNGHTDYYIGKSIPFQIEITIYVKDRSFWDITLESAEKFRELKNKKNLSLEESFQKSKHKHEATRYFKQIINEISKSSFSNEVLIGIYRAYGLFKSDCEEYSEAIDYYNKILIIDPENAEINFFIGYEYGLMNKGSIALDYLNKAADLGYQEAIDYIKINYS